MCSRHPGHALRLIQQEKHRELYSFGVLNRPTRQDTDWSWLMEASTYESELQHVKILNRQKGLLYGEKYHFVLTNHFFPGGPRERFLSDKGEKPHPIFLAMQNRAEGDKYFSVPKVTEAG